MYTLNEKIRDLEPYEPIAGEYKIVWTQTNRFCACRNPLWRPLCTP